MALSLLGAGDAAGRVAESGAGTMACGGRGTRAGVSGDPAAGIPEGRLRGTGRPAMSRSRPRDPAAGIPIRRPRVAASCSLAGRRADNPPRCIADRRPLLSAGQLLPVDRLHNPPRGIPHHFPAGLRHRGHRQSKRKQQCRQKKRSHGIFDSNGGRFIQENAFPHDIPSGPPNSFGFSPRAKRHPPQQAGEHGDASRETRAWRRETRAEEMSLGASFRLVQALCLLARVSPLALAFGHALSGCAVICKVLPPCGITPHSRLHALGTKHQAQSTKHKAQSTKHKAQSTKHKAPSTKHKAQSTKHSTAGATKHQAQPRTSASNFILFKRTK